MAGQIQSAESNDLFEVVTTAIIVKGDKYLILQRSPDKRRFPSRWTVPGGKLEISDFNSEPKDTEDYWYNVLEKTLAREVQEECGLVVKNVRYVTSLATVHEDGAPSLVVSCLVDYESGDVELQVGETVGSAWVNLQEAKRYDLIDGIYDELVMADDVRRGKPIEWQRFKK